MEGGGACSTTRGTTGVATGIATTSSSSVMEEDVTSSTASVGAFNIEDYIISENTEKDSRKFGSVYKSSHYIIEPAPQSVIEFNYVVKHKFLPDFLKKIRVGR